MLAVVGETATVTESGGGGLCFWPEEVEAVPQEARARASEEHEYEQEKAAQRGGHSKDSVRWRVGWRELDGGTEKGQGGEEGG